MSDWAVKKAYKRLSDGWSGDAWCMGPGEAADLLIKEHQRAVRIVKRIAKKDHWCKEVCDAILAALERGRKEGR